jgi:hypothetical protein
MDKRRMKLYFDQKVTRQIRNEKTNKSLIIRADKGIHDCQLNDSMPIGTYIIFSVLAHKRKIICPDCGNHKGIKIWQDETFYCDCGWSGGISNLPMITKEELDSIINKIYGK